MAPRDQALVIRVDRFSDKESSMLISCESDEGGARRTIVTPKNLMACKQMEVVVPPGRQARI